MSEAQWSEKGTKGDMDQHSAEGRLHMVKRSSASCESTWRKQTRHRPGLEKEALCTGRCGDEWFTHGKGVLIKSGNTPMIKKARFLTV